MNKQDLLIYLDANIKCLFEIRDNEEDKTIKNRLDGVIIGYKNTKLAIESGIFDRTITTNGKDGQASENYIS